MCRLSRVFDAIRSFLSSFGVGFMLLWTVHIGNTISENSILYHTNEMDTCIWVFPASDIWSGMNPSMAIMQKKKKKKKKSRFLDLETLIYHIQSAVLTYIGQCKPEPTLNPQIRQPLPLCGQIQKMTFFFLFFQLNRRRHSSKLFLP